MITFDSTLLGAVTRVFGSDDLSSTNEPTGDGQDSMIVLTLRSTPFHLHARRPGGLGLLQGSDDRQQGDNRSYVVNVLDTGPRPEPTRTARSTSSTCSAPDATNDVFLLRGESAIDDEIYNRPAFVSLLHNTVIGRPCAANAARAARGRPPSSASTTTPGLDDLAGGVFVYGRRGNDTFAVDDTSAPVDLDGGCRRRHVPDRPAVRLEARRRNRCGRTTRFPTTATTRGWLSNGISRPLIANGGDGNDVFAVYHEHGAS